MEGYEDWPSPRLALTLPFNKSSRAAVFGLIKEIMADQRRVLYKCRGVFVAVGLGAAREAEVGVKLFVKYWKTVKDLQKWKLSLIDYVLILWDVVRTRFKI